MDTDVGLSYMIHYFCMLKITNTEALQNFEFTLIKRNVDL
jgi:hypothetical protein